MIKILLDGGAGYIGSKLVGYLINSGYNVTVLDNLLYEKTSLLHYIENPMFSFIKQDVRNIDFLKRIIKNYDIIIPLAALVGLQICDKNPIDAELVNFQHIKTISDNKSKNQLLLFNNSNSGYGETDGITIQTENTLMNPISLYGQTKCNGEKIIRQLDNHVIFRLATVFGVSYRMRTDLLVNNLVWRAIKDKYIVLYDNKAIRNYVHINDVCRAFCYVLSNWEECKNEVYNLGNDFLNMSKYDLCKEINQQIPIEIIQAEYTEDKDKRNYKISSQKFYDKGFSCTFDLQYGIKELITAYNMIEDDFIVHANY